jgi:hypothetical protein
MPRKLRSPFETASSRLKLPVQKKPHWQRLGTGLSLGYRRNQGAGTWSIRAADGDGGEWLEKFGTADDHEPADGKRVFSYDQAVSEAAGCAAARMRRRMQPGRSASAKRWPPMKLICGRAAPIRTMPSDLAGI